MNNKGFAVSGIIYGILVLFIILLVGLLAMFNNRKNALDELKNRVLDDFSHNVNNMVYNFNTNSTFTPTIKGYYRITVLKNKKKLSTIMYLSKEDKLNLVFNNNINISINNAGILRLTDNDYYLNDNYLFIDPIYDETISNNQAIVIEYLNNKKNTSLDGIRYVKDCINGNNISNQNNWLEVKIISSGNNVALNKKIMGTNISNIERITDNNVKNGLATSSISGEQCIIIDLEKKYNIEAINVYHDTDINKKYYHHTISVSSDGNNYEIIYNNEQMESKYGITINTFNASEVMSVGNVYASVLELDGAKWLRVYHHNNLNGTVLWTAKSQVILDNGIDDVHKQSILYNLNNYKNDSGQFEFLLKYDNIDKYNRWIQKSNPVLTTESVSGYVPIKIDLGKNTFKGLCKSNSNSTFIDGSCGSNDWFFSIGATSTWNGGIPGYDDNAISGGTDLYVRIDNVNLK